MPHTSPDTTPSVAPVAVMPEASIPPEWQAELDGIHDHYHREQFMRALGELGIAVHEDSGSAEGELGEPPRGFTEWKKLPDPVEIPTDQFGGNIKPLADRESVSVDAIELTSDMGGKLLVCDLREVMGSAVSKSGPKTPQDQERLDGAFLRDMKILCDTGAGRNTVTGVSGVAYTKVGDSKLRSYWSNARSTEDTGGTRMVVRLADCGNDPGLQAKLYSVLFDRKM